MSRTPSTFGKRKDPHLVIIARGENIRHFTVRPWLTAAAGSALAIVAIGYLLATSYLVLRDDLIGASVARQARMQQAYEDRISALRAQVDRITSRQLLDQQLMETKVSKLIERQSELTMRHGKLRPFIERAEGDGVAPAPRVDTSETKPDTRADASAPTIDPKTAQLAAALLPKTPSPVAALWETRKNVVGTGSVADNADQLFLAINQSLRAIENEQMDRLATLASDADDRADQIAEALEGVGLQVDQPDSPESGIGGPYIPVDQNISFDTRVKELDSALERLEQVKQSAIEAPIHSPAKGFSVSSLFGVRRDPFLGKPAMHAGMDFRVPLGGQIHASGKGVVVKAGWNGGYGRMVEIDHGDGLTTRFAHMSRIDVKVGQKVERGSVVGAVGSTGRSTGPHLHYEVRRNGVAIDPLRFIKAGRRIAGLL